jgi:hypothetical protein
MSTQIFASLFTVLVIGLFIGTNLGVLLMCLMRMASPDTEPEAELAPSAVRAKD